MKLLIIMMISILSWQMLFWQILKDVTGLVIRLFPVFPVNQNASFKNIRTWGAFLASAKLENGTISDVKLISEKGKTCTLVNPWPDKKVVLFTNDKKAETMEGERIIFETAINETVEIKSI